MTEASIESITVKLLQGIRDDLAGLRDEVRSTNERLDKTNERLDRTNERLDRTNERLEALREETNRRFKTLEAATVAGFRSLEARLDNLLLGEHGQEHARLREMEGRVAACEQGIKDLRERMGP